MELDHINVDLIHRVLNAFRQHRPVPDEALTLDILNPHGMTLSRVDLEMALYDFLQETTTTTLNEYRRAWNMPPNNDLTRAGIDAQIAADFASELREFQAWSALYYRYLEPSFALDVSDLVRAANVQESRFRDRVNWGMENLTLVVRRAEQQAHHDRTAQRRRADLPEPDYPTPVGVISLVDQVADLLVSADDIHLISLEGIGGIGKTTIARLIADDLADSSSFEQIVWLSARQEWFSGSGEVEPVDSAVRTLDDLLCQMCRHLGLSDSGTREEQIERLRALCHVTPFLIIVDNLETLPEVHQLMPILHQLSGRTRFLITSRESVVDYSYVLPINIPELSFVHSHALFNSELRRHLYNTSRRDACLSERAMQPVFNAVGGVPLALKLVAAQAADLPLADVLHGLAAARHVSQQNMFTFIYRRAWELLDHNARTLLVSMVDSAPEGETADWLREMSDLDAETFTPALRPLLRRSLVETTGTADMPLYRLHRLTVTFLRTEIFRQYG